MEPADLPPTLAADPRPTLAAGTEAALASLAAVARRLREQAAYRGSATEKALLLNQLAQLAAAGTCYAARTDDAKGYLRVSALLVSLRVLVATLREEADACAPARRPPIGIRGKRGAGKDTLAAEVCGCFPEYGVRKWAAKLREAAALLAGIPAERTTSEADKEAYLGDRPHAPGDLAARIRVAAAHVLGDRPVPGDLPGRIFAILTGRAPETAAAVALPMTVGRLLQLLGTECFRHLVGPDVWVEALTRPWDSEGRPPIVVADTRFPNETAALRGAGGVIVLVQRAGGARADGRADGHASEVALDGEPADFVLDNGGSVADLRAAFLAAWPAILALAASRQ